MTAPVSTVTRDGLRREILKVRYVPDVDLNKMLDAILALLSLAQREDVREGWKLVPVEPTERMLRMADGCTDLIMPGGFEDRSAKRRQSEFADAYRVMLAAAPSPAAAGTLSEAKRGET